MTSTQLLTLSLTHLFCLLFSSSAATLITIPFRWIDLYRCQWEQHGCIYLQPISDAIRLYPNQAQLWSRIVWTKLWWVLNFWQVMLCFGREYDVGYGGWLLLLFAYLSSSLVARVRSIWWLRLFFARLWSGNYCLSNSYTLNNSWHNWNKSSSLSFICSRRDFWHS